MLSSLNSLSELRLAFAQCEKKIFKTPTQISLEIILFIKSNGDKVAMREIFKNIPSTAQTINVHLVALKKAEMIEYSNSETDLRQKYVLLTPKSNQLLVDYLNEIKTPLREFVGKANVLLK